jgi:hypothetical protein
MLSKKSFNVGFFIGFVRFEFIIRFAAAIRRAYIGKYYLIQYFVGI